jgi:ribosomal protein L37AE/L43A
MSKETELFQAFFWTCENCGRDQFERAIAVELNSEEMHELREDFGVESYTPGEFVRAPASVKCNHCGEQFQTNASTSVDDYGC